MQVNGIDINALEERMALIDWRTYFNNESISPEVADTIGNTISELAQLSEGNTNVGKQAQHRLISAYWPREAVGLLAKKEATGEPVLKPAARKRHKETKHGWRKR